MTNNANSIMTRMDNATAKMDKLANDAKAAQEKHAKVEELDKRITAKMDAKIQEARDWQAA